MEKCHEVSHGYDTDPTCLVYWQSLRRNCRLLRAFLMWDGVGKLAVDSINMRDYPMILAYVVWMAIIYVLVNLVTDLLYRVLDPRIRLGEKAKQ